MDSQIELRNIDKIYIEGGGQFFVASCSHDEIAGFVGLKLDQGIAELRRLATVEVLTSSRRPQPPIV